MAERDSTTNGITDKFLQQAIDEVERALASNKLSRMDRVQFITHRSVLHFIRDERNTIKKIQDELKVVKEHSILLWIKNNKVTAGILFSALLIVNSYWNWAGLRAGWLGPLLSALGIPISLP